MNESLAAKKCVPCEGGVPALTPAQVETMRPQIPLWTLTPDGKRLRRTWKLKNFVAGLAFFQKIGELAEAEEHHPDLHLTEYRNAAVEIWTHAIGGLSENDFILAAKIDRIPVETRG